MISFLLYIISLDLDYVPTKNLRIAAELGASSAFSKVDPEFESNIYDFLKELNRHATIVTITHDVGVISRYIKSVACVNQTLVYHEEPEITHEMLDMAYECPVDLIAHGIPHRVLPDHGKR